MYQFDCVVFDINVQVISHTTTKTEYDDPSSEKKSQILLFGNSVTGTKTSISTY